MQQRGTFQVRMPRVRNPTSQMENRFEKNLVGLPGSPQGPPRGHMKKIETICNFPGFGFFPESSRISIVVVIVIIISTEIVVIVMVEVEVEVVVVVAVVVVVLIILGGTPKKIFHDSVLIWEGLQVAVYMISDQQEHEKWIRNIDFLP